MTLSTAELRRRLLAWYDAHRRDLPWRRTRDPYRIWISEVMLQQTRVETVIPYYERWLGRFPTIDALASASLEEVLEYWAGLGYYARAHNLHQAAHRVKEQYTGVLPQDPVALRSLPGVGPYTAAAVASMAYDRPEPAVDGNVRRVLCRLLDMDAPTAGRLRDAAAPLVASARPGDVNQALMELGAVLCTPRSPDCPRCPLAAACRARARDAVSERPGRKRSKPLSHRHFGVAVLVNPNRRILVRRRPLHGLLAGMLELPNEEAPAGRGTRAAAVQAVREVVGEGEGLPRPTALGAVTHVFSHFRATYDAYLFRGDRPTIESRPGLELHWLDPGRVEGRALPTAHKKLAALVRAELELGDACEGAIHP